MRKKSTSKSAFFNLRVVAALLVGMTGVSLALFAANPFGPSRVVPAKNAKAQQKYNPLTGGPDISVLPPGFDCSKIHQLGIDRMEGLRWGLIMLACGQGKGGTPPIDARFHRFVQKLMPKLPQFGGADIDLVTGTETFPNTTQSETFVTANPDDPTQVCVAFNDSRGANSSNFSGISCSTDGGNTFTRVTNASGNSPFANTFGDPVVLYNSASGTWFTVWLDGNFPCTLGGYKSTNPSDPNSWTHFCVHQNGGDDRESGWADNNPASPHAGNMYVSWNDFGVGSGALVVSRSTDNGNTWSPEIIVSNAGFVRDVQITGDSANGDVYIAGIDEGGGNFPHTDFNLMFKSTDGGATWANTYNGSGASFPGPGVVACSVNTYFSCMFTDNGGYWRYEGEGQPAALNGIVHYVYSQHGAGSDPGDVYYIRSTDGGFTFSAPFLLNTDGGTRPQWQPNLSVSPSGTLLATWYDARDSASCTEGDENVPCYRMYSRKSNDGGLSWLPDDVLSDVVTPLAAEQDPQIFGNYAGDYDYSSAIAFRHMTTWMDGRVTISGQSQQDAFFDKDLVGFSVTTTDPACGSLVVGTAPTDFTVDLSDPADPSTVQATDFTVNGTPADQANLSNGNQTIDFIFNSSPVTAGSNTMHIDAGAIHQASNNDPILEFDCTFRYTQVQLAVTDTEPPVGGTFTPPAPGTYDYRVNLNKAVDEASVQDTDLQLSGNTGAAVTGHTFEDSDMTIHFTLNIQFGGSLTAHIAAGAIADTFGNPNADFSGSYTVSGCPPGEYAITDGTDTIVPGTTDTGNHCDDCSTFVSLPFSFTLYDQTYNGVYVDSNGRLDFVCTAGHTSDWVSQCLPATDAVVCPYTYTVFASWTDQCTDNTPGNCGGDNCTGCGIFTSVEGSPGSQIFHIEWRTVLYASGGTTPVVHFEVNLFENSGQFEVVYGDINPALASQMWIGGVQKDEVSVFFTQDFCLPVGDTPPTNVSRTYAIPLCSPTPTPTPVVTPTPRPPPTPRPRPTPHPRPSPP